MTPARLRAGVVPRALLAPSPARFLATSLSAWEPTAIGWSTSGRDSSCLPPEMGGRQPPWFPIACDRPKTLLQWFRLTETALLVRDPRTGGTDELRLVDQRLDLLQIKIAGAAGQRAHLVRSAAALTHVLLLVSTLQHIGGVRTEASFALEELMSRSVITNVCVDVKSAPVVIDVLAYTSAQEAS